MFRFKYGNTPELAWPLAEYMVRAWNQKGTEVGGWTSGGSLAVAPTIDWVVPVPLHPERQGERGYNQSELLAREVARLLRRPWHNFLHRVRPTLSQHGLSARDRRRNVQGAFMLADTRPVCGQRILLIDDILTSGTTADEAGCTLLQSGAATVYALIFARALP